KRCFGGWTMTAHSSGVTKGLQDRLLKDQERRAERERRLPFAEKLRILDQLMAERAAAEERELAETAGERHGCGGALHPVKIDFERFGPDLFFVVRVAGVRCDRCGERFPVPSGEEDLEWVAAWSPGASWQVFSSSTPSL